MFGGPGILVAALAAGGGMAQVLGIAMTGLQIRQIRRFFRPGVKAWTTEAARKALDGLVALFRKVFPRKDQITAEAGAARDFSTASPSLSTMTTDALRGVRGGPPRGLDRVSGEVLARLDVPTLSPSNRQRNYATTPPPSSS